MTCCSRSPPWRVSLIAVRKNLSPKQLSHSTGLFDYSASSLKPNSFTQKHFYTRSLHTETRLHRDAVTRKAVDTTHKRFYTQILFTQRPFYTQKLAHTDPYWHLHTEMLYTQTERERESEREREREIYIYICIDRYIDRKGSKEAAMTIICSSVPISSDLLPA